MSLHLVCMVDTSEGVIMLCLFIETTFHQADADNRATNSRSNSISSISSGSNEENEYYNNRMRQLETKVTLLQRQLVVATSQAPPPQPSVHATVADVLRQQQQIQEQSAAALVSQLTMFKNIMNIFQPQAPVVIAPTPPPPPVTQPTSLASTQEPTFNLATIEQLASMFK